MARSTSTSGACDSVSAASGVADTESYDQQIFFVSHANKTSSCTAVLQHMCMDRYNVLHAYTLYPYAQMQPYEFHVFGLFQPRFEPIFTCFHRLRDSQSPARNPLIN